VSLTGSTTSPVTSTIPALHSRSLPRWAEDLQGLRKRLQDAWSDATIHESFKSPAGVQVMPSHGQCGVSSAWLVETLGAAHVRDLSYCYGDVYSMDEPERVEIERHCWVEVKCGEDRLVVDLTGDQAEILRAHPIVCAWHDELQTALRVDYRPRRRMTPLQLKYDPVRDRLKVLKQVLEAER
jgi:hypothetical protein